MNSKLIVVVLAFVVSGCQVSMRLGADGTFVPHSHEPIPAPAQTAVEVVTKSDNDNPPVCPSIPAVAECPAAEPVVKASSDTQTSPSEVSSPESNPPAAESQNAQLQEKQSQDSQQQEQNSEQQTLSEQSDAAEVAVDEKPSTPVETFDIEKYLEQSASCVQQNPCSQSHSENQSGKVPKSSEQTNTEEPAKVIESTKGISAVNERKGVGLESGIQRVDRRRVPIVKQEQPPTMPR